MRKEIVVDKPVKRATAFFCGLGHSELYIDGVKVGVSRLSPGFTTYNKRVQYLVYDVTDRFTKAGRNVLGAVLAEGWYGLERDPCHDFARLPYVDRPKMRLDLRLEYTDGSETVIVSDPSWKWSQAEITRSWVCGEEDIDLRRSQPGWDRIGFDNRHWKPAKEVQGPTGRMVCQRETPTRVMEVVRPVSLTADPAGNGWIYDFGREFTGAIRFRASGKAGAGIGLNICLPFGMDGGSGGRPYRPSVFVLAGTGKEEYSPRFYYNAISRVMVQGMATPPALEDMDAVALSGVAEASGSFRCSNDLLNWLHEKHRRTQRAFVTFLPNDSTREYKAWMEDPQNMFCSAVQLFDSRAMYERWQRDMLDGQDENGNGANIAPGPVCGTGYNSTWWGGCLVWMPWHWYQYYGDPSLLFESYEGMKRYVDYLSRVGKDHMQDWGLGDWITVEETPTPIMNTPAYYLYAQRRQPNGRDARQAG